MTRKIMTFVPITVEIIKNPIHFQFEYATVLKQKQKGKKMNPKNITTNN